MPEKRKPANLNQLAGEHPRRPQYEPTQSDRVTVKNMAAAGIPHERIAECVGDEGIDDKTLRKHFRRELDVSRDQVTALAMSKVIQAMNNGEAWACCFWLKCRAGWKEINGLEHTGPGGAPLTLTVQLVKPKDTE